QELDETVQMQQKKIEAQRAELQAIKKTQQDELSAIKKALEKAGISLD
ncbi:MAG: ABC-type phosphate transport system auxiliary subunit, partial [Saprospiraceae bacterium]